MQQILEYLQKKKCWKSFLKTQCRKNKIDSTLANTFTIIKIRSFFQKLQNIEIPIKSRLKSSVWLQNQLKAYQWMLVAYSSYKGQLIQTFSQNQWTQLSNIFHKDQSILQYQAKKLISDRLKLKKKWDNQEIKILQNILKQNPGSNKWNEVARKLFEISGKQYFRSGKQCRQRWFNHLDPQKKHGQWQSTEDRVIVQQIIKNGKKWSQIGKKLQNHRTQHMIKNRFKSIIIKLKKKYSDMKSEKDILERFLQEGKNFNENSQNSSEIDQEHEQQIQKIEKLSLKGLPVIQSQNELQQDGIIRQQNSSNFQHMNIQKYPSSFRQCQFQQVVTPCPIIYQTFTPTFLNTPNSITFLMNYSFDQLQKNQNLFLKNNN